MEKQKLEEYLWSEECAERVEVPDWHKDIVRDRISQYNNSPQSYLSWKEIEKRLISEKCSLH